MSMSPHPMNKPAPASSPERPRSWGGEGLEVEQLWTWASEDKPIKLRLADGAELVGMCRRVEKFWIALFTESRGTVLVNKGFIMTIEAA
jgi:hypothetical protein